MFEHMLLTGICRDSILTIILANNMINEAKKGKEIQHLNAVQESCHISHGDHIEYLMDWST